MEEIYLNDMQKKLLSSNPSLKFETLVDSAGNNNIKICKKAGAWASSSLKYNPPYFAVITISGGSALTIMIITHNEEIVEEVDFKVRPGVSPNGCFCG